MGEQAFVRWVNHTLQERERSIADLETGFTDGVNLCHLLEVVSGKRLGFHANPNNNIKCTENVSIALEFLSRHLGFKSYGLNAQDVEVRRRQFALPVTRIHVRRRLFARRRPATRRLSWDCSFS